MGKTLGNTGFQVPDRRHSATHSGRHSGGQGEVLYGGKTLHLPRILCVKSEDVHYAGSILNILITLCALTRSSGAVNFAEICTWEKCQGARVVQALDVPTNSVQKQVDLFKVGPRLQSKLTFQQGEKGS